jgi:hypothetical protein
MSAEEQTCLQTLYDNSVPNSMNGHRNGSAKQLGNAAAFYSSHLAHVALATPGISVRTCVIVDFFSLPTNDKDYKLKSGLSCMVMMLPRLIITIYFLLCLPVLDWIF